MIFYPQGGIYLLGEGPEFFWRSKRGGPLFTESKGGAKYLEGGSNGGDSELYLRALIMVGFMQSHTTI